MLDKYCVCQGNKVYLRTINGCLKKFENVLRNVLEENKIEFIDKYLMLEGNDIKAARNVGDYIIISTLWPKEEIEKSIIHEVIGIHYEDVGIIENEEPEEDLEKITNMIWRNKEYRKLIQELIKNKK